ncbi:hypothetical protein PM082_023248 [Marasmius tenuissimus]|nr:hypothetical protein PM082_023248 [Marasmius tenuissimus]
MPGNKKQNTQVEVVVPRLCDLPEYDRITTWVVLQGPVPGVHYTHQQGTFAKGYEDASTACQDYSTYVDCGLVDLLNRPSTTAGEWSVVTEGFRVGVYPDRISALVIGLKWDFGTFALFRSENEAYSHFAKELDLGRVRTKVVTEVRVPHLMFPQKRVEWIVETA